MAENIQWWPVWAPATRFACNNVCEGGKFFCQSWVLQLLISVTLFSTVLMLQEREIRCSVSPAIGKELLHVIAARILAAPVFSVPWCGIGFTCISGLWHHTIGNWPCQSCRWREAFKRTSWRIGHLVDTFLHALLTEELLLIFLYPEETATEVKREIHIWKLKFRRHTLKTNSEPQR